jgi:hypothetical protein
VTISSFAGAATACCSLLAAEMAGMTKADGENSKSLQDSDPTWAACLFLHMPDCLAVWLSTEQLSGMGVEWSEVEVGGASEGVWLKRLRARKALQQKAQRVKFPHYCLTAKCRVHAKI